MVNMDHPLMFENVWLDKWRVEDAEIHYQEHLAGTSKPKEEEHQRSELSREIARARQQIQKSLKSDNVPVGGITDNAVVARIESLEKENKELRKVTNDLRQLVTNMEKRISTLEAGSQTTPAATPQKEEKKTEKKEDDDDFELFGSDDEEEKAEAEKIKEERIKQYAEKKAKKPVLIAKSNIILDVKPWDDETDMAKLEKAVRSVQMDGLLWGASKLVAVGYGIRKLQISCVVEDDKVSTDDLEERITAFEEFIQSMDIAAFNKV